MVVLTRGNEDMEEDEKINVNMIVTGYDEKPVSVKKCIKKSE